MGGIRHNYDLEVGVKQRPSRAKRVANKRPTHRQREAGVMKVVMRIKMYVHSYLRHWGCHRTINFLRGPYFWYVQLYWKWKCKPKA